MNTASPYAKAIGRGRDNRRESNEALNKIPSVVSFNPIDSLDPTSKNMKKKMAIPIGDNFAACYMELCKQQRIRPLPVICVTLPHSLDLTTDRVKMDDWGPILNSLSLDRSLKSVSVRSRYQCRKPLEEINSEVKARKMAMKHKEPVVLTRYLLEWLSHSVAQCLRNSRALTWLELEGVPFPADCLAVLCVGLAGTSSLSHLSLRRCCIGYNGCELVCRTISDLRSLKSLDLSECDLSESCASSLAAALSRQKLSLYHETWKESLRYREPNLDAMPGLRRLTLNGNPRLGDQAVEELIEAVRDSLWLKALDLQNCGLTDNIGQQIIRLLENNTTLAIVDVRMNWNLSDEMLGQIFQRLESNGGNTVTNGKSTYMWMSLTRKDQRNAVSAGGVRKNRYDVPTRTENIFRPKSAKPYRGIYNAKPCALKNKASVVNEKTTTTEKPKISLNLDLQSRIESNVGTKILQIQQSSDNEIESNIVEPNDDNDMHKNTQHQEKQEQDTIMVNKILRELSEARMEQERLLEETKKTDKLLAEEKQQREIAETKLRRMKENLSELEAALKKKERETRGFLLVSQRSLDDIATSFDKLLEMLENATKRKTPPQQKQPTEYNEDECSLARAEIRRRVAHLIRKTKSENHGRRGFRVDLEESSVIEASSSAAKKFARSEGDIGQSCPVSSNIQPIRLERNIGDSPDVVSSRTRDTRLTQAAYRESAYNEGCNKVVKSSLPCERARAIFARIINGDAILHLHGGHGT